MLGLVRKNSLFAGSDEGAKAIAVHLSFIATAKRNGVNPVDWYADVLSRINELKTKTNWNNFFLTTGRDHQSRKAPCHNHSRKSD
ncbi:unnamed protein product [Sphagnum balticum]